MQRLVFFLFCVSTVAPQDLTNSPNAPQEFISSYLDFASKLLQSVYDEKPGNMYISLLSPVITFGLARTGAKGSTRDQITTALELSDSIDLDEVISRLTNDIEPNLQSFRNYFICHDIQVNDQFKKVAETKYHVTITPQDFSDPEAAAAAINLRSAASTLDVIRTSIKKSDLDANTKIATFGSLAVQAGFLGGAFDPSLTTTGDFSKSKDESVQVQYLTDTCEYFYYEDTDLNVKMLLIELEGAELRLTIVLPNEIDGLDELQKQVDKLIQLDAGKFNKELVSVTIPKFEFASVWDVNQLKNEMPSLFDGGNADLSGIGGDPGDLFINVARQKSYIRLDEGGLLAPLVTAIEGSSEGAGVATGNPTTKEFKADHPFLFFVRQYGIVHFAGRLNNPNEEVEDL